MTDAAVATNCGRENEPIRPARTAPILTVERNSQFDSQARFYYGDGFTDEVENITIAIDTYFTTRAFHQVKEVVTAVEALVGIVSQPKRLRSFPGLPPSPPPSPTSFPSPRYSFSSISLSSSPSLKEHDGTRGLLRELGAFMDYLARHVRSGAELAETRHSWTLILWLDRVALLCEMRLPRRASFWRIPIGSRDDRLQQEEALNALIGRARKAAALVEVSLKLHRLRRRGLMVFNGLAEEDAARLIAAGTEARRDKNPRYRPIQPGSRPVPTSIGELEQAFQDAVELTVQAVHASERAVHDAGRYFGNLAYVARQEGRWQYSDRVWLQLSRSYSDYCYKAEVFSEKALIGPARTGCPGVLTGAPRQLWERSPGGFYAANRLFVEENGGQADVELMELDLLNELLFTQTSAAYASWRYHEALVEVWQEAWSVIDLPSSDAYFYKKVKQCWGRVRPMTYQRRWKEVHESFYKNCIYMRQRDAHLRYDF